jgi:hypothetical protein
LVYGEARDHSALARQIYSEKFPQSVLPSAGTFVNVVQHLRFEMNKRQRKIAFYLQKKKFFTKLKTSHKQILSVLPGSFSVCNLAASSKRCSGNSSKQRHFKSSASFRHVLLKLDGRHFEQLL